MPTGPKTLAQDGLLAIINQQVLWCSTAHQCNIGLRSFQSRSISIKLLKPAIYRAPCSRIATGFHWSSYIRSSFNLFSNSLAVLLAKLLRTTFACRLNSSGRNELFNTTNAKVKIRNYLRVLHNDNLSSKIN